MERNWFTFKIFLAIIAIQIAPKLTFVQNSAAVQHFASAISIRSNSEDFDNCKVDGERDSDSDYFKHNPSDCDAFVPKERKSKDCCNLATSESIPGYLNGYVSIEGNALRINNIAELMTNNVLIPLASPINPTSYPTSISLRFVMIIDAECLRNARNTLVTVSGLEGTHGKTYEAYPMMTISYARYDATNAYHRNISRNNNNNCDLCRNTVFLETFSAALELEIGTAIYVHRGKTFILWIRPKEESGIVKNSTTFPFDSLMCPLNLHRWYDPPLPGMPDITVGSDTHQYDYAYVPFRITKPELAVFDQQGIKFSGGVHGERYKTCLKGLKFLNHALLVP